MSEKTLVSTLDGSINNELTILFGMAQKEGNVTLEGGVIPIPYLPDYDEISSFFGARGFHTEVGLCPSDSRPFFIRLSPIADRSRKYFRSLVSEARTAGTFNDGFGGFFLVSHSELPTTVHPELREYLSSLGYECGIITRHEHGNPQYEISAKPKSNSITQMIERLDLP